MGKIKRKKGLLLSLALCLSVLVVSALSAADFTPAGSGAAGCVSWTSEARYEGLGYKQIGAYILGAIGNAGGKQCRVLCTPTTLPYYERNGFFQDHGHIVVTKVPNEQTDF